MWCYCRYLLSVSLAHWHIGSLAQCSICHWLNVSLAHLLIGSISLWLNVSMAQYLNDPISLRLNVLIISHWPNVSLAQYFIGSMSIMKHVRQNTTQIPRPHVSLIFFGSFDLYIISCKTLQSLLLFKINKFIFIYLVLINSCSFIS